MHSTTRSVLLAIVISSQMTDLVSGSPPAADVAPFTADEMRNLETKEKLDMGQSDWGLEIAEVVEMRAAFEKSRPITLSELQSLEERYDASLEDTIAAGAGSRLLLFMPDRFLDLVDMVTFGVGLAGGVGAEVHITRWASLGAFAQAGIGILWYYNRNLAYTAFYGAHASFGPWQAYQIGFAGGGTGWTQGAPDSNGKRYSKNGKFSMEDKMVQDGWTDPWGIGFGWAAEIHPVEMADFVAGLLTLGFVDISKDDYANPKRTGLKIGLPVERES